MALQETIYGNKVLHTFNGTAKTLLDVLNSPTIVVMGMYQKELSRLTRILTGLPVSMDQADPAHDDE